MYGIVVNLVDLTLLLSLFGPKVVYSSAHMSCWLTAAYILDSACLLGKVEAVP